MHRVSKVATAKHSLFSVRVYDISYDRFRRSTTQEYSTKAYRYIIKATFLNPSKFRCNMIQIHSPVWRSFKYANKLLRQNNQ